MQINQEALCINSASFDSPTVPGSSVPPTFLDFNCKFIFLWLIFKAALHIYASPVPDKLQKQQMKL